MKKRILIAVYALLLCTTISFAWISNIENNYVNQIIFKPDSLKVVDREMSASLVVDGKLQDNGFQFEDKLCIPGSIVPFQIRINNEKAESDTPIKLTLAMNVSDARLLDVMFVDFVAGDGFNLSGENYHVYRKLSESVRIGEENSGDFLLDIYGDTNRILIPNKESVTLNGFFFLSEEATAVHQGMALNAISFRIE